MTTAVSVDNGETWDTTDPTNPAIINTVDTQGYNSSESSATDIEVNGSTVDTGSSWKLMFTKSTNVGTTWPVTGVTIDNGADVGSFLDLTVVGDSIYISYYDWDTGDLKFAKSIDGGDTW